MAKRELVLALAVMGFAFMLLHHATEPRREHERAMHCASNLNQIGLACIQYAQDYDEIYPRSWYGRDAGPSDGQVNYKWMDAIYPYAKSTEMFTCPDDGVSKPYSFRDGTNYGSYVINNSYYAPGDAQTPPAGARLDRIAESSATLLVSDGDNDFQFAWPDVAHAPATTTAFPRTIGTICGRHGGHRQGEMATIMPLYCDGHVLLNPLEYISRPKIIKRRNVYTGFTIEPD